MVVECSAIVLKVATRPSESRPFSGGFNAAGIEDALLCEEAAFAAVERIRWGRGEICPHCAAVGRFGRLRGGRTPSGVYKCYACRRLFTLKTGTGLEGSHLAYATWLSAIYLLVAWNGAISAGFLSELLGITIQTATKLRRTLAPYLAMRTAEGRQSPSGAPVRPQEAARAPRDDPGRSVEQCCQTAGSAPSPRQQRQNKLRAMARSVHSPEVERAFWDAVTWLVFSTAEERAIGDAAQGADAAPERRHDGGDEAR
jgi:transposase-like protein